MSKGKSLEGKFCDARNRAAAPWLAGFAVLSLLLSAPGCASVRPSTGALDLALPIVLTASGDDEIGNSLSDNPKLILRDRLDLAGADRRDAVLGTSFSHRSQRFHAYPFTTYGRSHIEIELSVRDPRMRLQSAVWVLGPKQDSGEWGPLIGAAADGGRVSVEAEGLDEYLVIVGPRDAGAFLPRFPGIEALLELETEDGFEEETATLSLPKDADAPAILRFEGDWDPEFSPLAGRSFRLEDPAAGLSRVDALPPKAFDLLFAAACTEASCEETEGELLTFAPRAWTRFQLFAPEDAVSLEDTRLGSINDPQEGFFTIYSAETPHTPEASYQILEAIGADGAPNAEDPALLRVVPLVHAECEVDLIETPNCYAGPGRCRVPTCLGSAAPVPSDLPVLAFRATALDFDETSLYDLEARCSGDCSPRARPTRYPVYLAHGFNSSKEVWEGITSRVVGEDPRWEGWIAAESVPPFEPVWRRTEALRRNLTAYLGRLSDRGISPAEGESIQRLNVIAHSMGGLDSRFLMGHEKYNNDSCHERLECTDEGGNPEACCSAGPDGEAVFWRERLASVTTLSTPHRGSSFADLGVRLLENRGIDWGFRQAARYVFGLDSEAEQQYLRETLFTLSNQFADETMTPDFPAPQPERVYDYACAAGKRGGDQGCALSADADRPPGASRLPPPNTTATLFSWASEACLTGACGSIVDPGLALPYAVVKKEEGASDGVVATESAEFGIYMGIRANDHFHWNRLSFAGVVDLAARAFGVKREPVDRFYAHWLGTLSKSGY